MTRAASSRARRAALTALLIGGAVLLAGCFNPFSPLIAPMRGQSEPSPIPSTPQNALRLFEWCWNHRSISEYREIFTDDYEFFFAEGDSAGNAYRDRPYRREDELVSTENLFVHGSATDPPANSITLNFDATLVSIPDRREGKDSRWNREIITGVVLRIDTDREDFQVEGEARFFLARGDHAVIPDELIQRGFSTTDSTRWFIERWEDETIQDHLTQVLEAAARRDREGPAGTSPAPGPGPARGTREFRVTWGWVKWFYDR